MANELTTVASQVPAIPADSIDERVAQNLNKFFRDKSAFSQHTMKNLFSRVRVWAKWCEKRGHVWFPAEPETFRLFLLDLQRDGRAASTVANYSSMINMLHVQAGIASPTHDTAVTLVKRRIKREAKENGEKEGQAVPFRFADLKRVQAVIGLSKDISHMRDLAFLSLAYNTLLRMSEIGRIRVGDIEITEEGRAALSIGFTKTVEDVSKVLSVETTRLLMAWISAAGLEGNDDAYVFCPVSRHKKITLLTEKPMTDKPLEAIFANAWRLVNGSDTRRKNKSRYGVWSGHSARVGAAQDLTAAGVDLPKLMHEGQWQKPETVMRYIRNINASEGAMNQIMDN